MSDKNVKFESKKLFWNKILIIGQKLIKLNVVCSKGHTKQTCALQKNNQMYIHQQHKL